METCVYGSNDIVKCATLIQKGWPVAFPTETVYGLGANAENNDACLAVYAAKGRPQDNPFIVHVSSIEEADRVVESIPAAAKALLSKFSPGPLTIVLKKSKYICSAATAGGATVGLRVPAHPVARAFLRACGVPVAAPSANKSGRPSPTDAQMVFNEMNGVIGAILDGGTCRVGIESTVVSILNNKITLLRAGEVTLESMIDVLGGERIDVLEHELITENPKSPGLKYAHYRPGVPVFLFKRELLDSLIKSRSSDRVGLIYSTPRRADLPKNWISYDFSDIENYGRGLYKTLLELDAAEVAYVAAEDPGGDGPARAVTDRLSRAAENRYIS